MKYGLFWGDTLTSMGWRFAGDAVEIAIQPDAIARLSSPHHGIACCPSLATAAKIQIRARGRSCCPCGRGRPGARRRRPILAWVGGAIGRRRVECTGPDADAVLVRVLLRCEVAVGEMGQGDREPVSREPFGKIDAADRTDRNDAAVLVAALLGAFECLVADPFLHFAGRFGAAGPGCPSRMQDCAFSGASMPNRRMRSPVICRVSPSMTVAGPE